jgi:hypothetical protein
MISTFLKYPLIKKTWILTKRPEARNFKVKSVITNSNWHKKKIRRQDQYLLHREASAKCCQHPSKSGIKIKDSAAKANNNASSKGQDANPVVIQMPYLHLPSKNVTGQ